MRRSARKVSRSGSPGPAPTRDTSPPLERPARESSSAACRPRARLGFAPAEHQLGDRPLQHALPEAPPFRRLEARLDLVAERAGQRGEAAVAGGNERLQARAQQPRQHGRGAAAGYRDDEGRALDDRGQDERAQRRLVGHVHRDAPRLGRGGHGPVDLLIAGGGDHQRIALQLLLAELRRHRDLRARAPQQRALARRHLAAADHQAGLFAYVEKDRQEVHGVAGARPRGLLAMIDSNGKSHAAAHHTVACRAPPGARHRHRHPDRPGERRLRPGADRGPQRREMPRNDPLPALSPLRAGRAAPDAVARSAAGLLRAPGHRGGPAHHRRRRPVPGRRPDRLGAGARAAQARRGSRRGGGAHLHRRRGGPAAPGGAGASSARATTSRRAGASCAAPGAWSTATRCSSRARCSSTSTRRA